MGARVGTLVGAIVTCPKNIKIKGGKKKKAMRRETKVKGIAENILDKVPVVVEIELFGFVKSVGKISNNFSFNFLFFNYFLSSLSIPFFLFFFYLLLFFIILLIFYFFYLF